LNPVVTRAAEKTDLKNRILALNAAFCRLVYLQLLTDQKDVAEACGSRTQTFNSQGHPDTLQMNQELIVVEGAVV
jgi:hypothetical protein